MYYKDLTSSLKKAIQKLPTPFFLFDLDVIAQNISVLRKHLSPDRICYAVKCNSLPEVLRTMQNKNCCFEANNLSELNKCLEAGAHADKIINSSPLTSAADVNAMAKAGVDYFTVDSFDQVDNLACNAPGTCINTRIYTTNQGSRFVLSKRLGISCSKAEKLITYAQKKGLQPKGITFHVGSQCKERHNWETGIRECSELFKVFPFLESMNIGGGFPVQYNAMVPGIDQIAETILDAIRKYFDTPPILHVEPGRFLVGDAALTCTSVLQVNNRHPVSRAIVDMSVFNGFIEILESQNDFHYPVEVPESEEKSLYCVGGPTCAGTDILIKEIMLPKLTADHVNFSKSSRIYFANTGAYTVDFFSGPGNGFNGSPAPKLYFVNNGRITKNN
ncbi:MAG: alanine racemase [Fibrobacteria bacterium]|nr:alanine racemase [Fibrobacteria bacterium]